MESTHTKLRGYGQVMRSLREFCSNKGLVEVYTQGSLDNLKACEDPNNLGTFGYQGKVWALPQTGQMGLEKHLLTDRELSKTGLFCQTTSYRNEPDPNPERHDMIFPMFEFELVGGLGSMITWEDHLLRHLGFGTDGVRFPVVKYLDMARKYDVKELEHKHERLICKDFSSPVVFLRDFPDYTSPFWNMRRYTGSGNDTKISKKVDVLIHGVETIGSAERSVDPAQMRHEFHTISDGDYARTLYQHFSKERTVHELEDFLKLDFFDRSGGGIGITRLLRGMRLSGLV